MTRIPPAELGTVSCGPLNDPLAWPLVAVSAYCSLAYGGSGQDPPPEPSVALVDDKRIDRIDEDEPGACLAYGRGDDEHRSSPLAQINREAAKDVGLAWTRKIGVRQRLQLSPIVVDGVIYCTDGWSVVSLVDADRARPSGRWTRRRAGGWRAGLAVAVQ